MGACRYTGFQLVSVVETGLGEAVVSLILHFLQLVECFYLTCVRSCFRWSDDENGACEEISGLGGMELAMETWADWVASHVDPRKKKVFFVTMSPTHLG